ncbi:SWIM zinc finger family protein [Agrobacterium rosae]|uniref:SWIM zinc finger family protein n=1 Tax=Agrobacterium rosae TaxID=1972867 RepID=UPI003A8100F1
MLRPDLVALTDQGLIQLSNAGLVKRALRELETAALPDLEEAKDAITARFADGTSTRLSSGQALADAACSCPSSGMCRHRVMLAVAYRARHLAVDTCGASELDWSPASFDAEQVAESLSASAKAELSQLLRSRHTVRLEYGKTPAAYLPMASVRFLVPAVLSYARCDCELGTYCAHVGMAVKAFQEAKGTSQTVIGGVLERGAGIDIMPLRVACDAVIERLLKAGVVAGQEAHAQTIEAARRSAQQANAVQLLLVLEALEEQISDYDNRSARHEELVVLQLVAGLFARTRATDSASALGLGDLFETPMGKTRLVSLGARLRQEGTDIRASVLLADSDTGATMSMEKPFSPLPTEDARGFVASLPTRQMSVGMPVGGVGRGQILTSVARRRADGMLTLGRGSGGRSQLMPRDALFTFPQPLAATSVERVAAELSNRQIALLRPHRRFDTLHVFDIGEVTGQSWAPGRQLWEAGAHLSNDGGKIWFERPFDAAAPGAPGILAVAFEGKWGPVRQVAGTVRLDGNVVVCEPCSISADRFIVPDLEVDESDHTAAAIATPVQRDVLNETEDLLSGMLHAGQRSRGTVQALAPVISARLRESGYRQASQHISPDSEITTMDVERFCKAALWLLTLRESRDTETA